jgi:aminoglycoside phosphotransferase (APT) family kinase protein
MPELHPDELKITASLVARLVGAQFPQWAELPLVQVVSGGTDNALFRLGDRYVARLPRLPAAAPKITADFRWLPRLAPHVPLAIPTPLALAEPTADFPYPWGVYTWLEGESITLKGLRDPADAARSLAGFLQALQGVDTTGGPLPGPHNSGRGVPLATRDEAVRRAITELIEQNDPLDPALLLSAWEAALAAPAHTGPPVWLHGDLMPGNLLVQDGWLSAVIDFGCLGIGDPACDLQPAWNLFDATARAAFREALPPDDATWERGRGWALSVGLIALPYYKHSWPAFAALNRRTIEETLRDSQSRQ